MRSGRVTLLALLSLASCQATAPGPVDTVAAYASALRDGRHADAWRMLSTTARGALTFVAARGHHGALRVLAASWAVVPPGGALPTGDAWLRAAVEATGEALVGGLLVASSGLLAVVAAELVAALVARFSWPVTREGAGAVRALVGVGAVALGLRAAAEVAVALGQRSHAIAAGMR